MPYTVPAAASPTVAAAAVATSRPGSCRSVPNRTTTPTPEHDLDQHQLDRDGRGLAEKDPGRVEPRQAQAVPGPVGRLDGEAALHGQQRAQQHCHPEQARGRPA